ncbi:deoxyinosine 3'endonuclease (endonuclease V) [Fervidobacterium pennivorans DSM 9078]|uniref:Endonuclease V n=2 Tax=Fervidobacterium pennivorans TaxID=93466 RepID=H9UBJ0_FERPD|nr:deoxyinosine 3'endonuclease (endonuclease V) [Fervidobacterium pennivorans DSM 9078]
MKSMVDISNFLYPKTLEEAERIQKEFLKKLVLVPLDFSKVSLIAGVDVSYVDDQALGIVVVINKNFEIIEVVHERLKVTFPYIPGFLAFREAPVILKCFEKLKNTPDVILFDGQGIAHPRRLGIASHVGILLNIPTIGVAKTILYGKCEKPSFVGQATELKDRNGEVIGFCYLSKKNTKPIVISPGYKTDLESSLHIVKSLLNGFKLPEPVRLAHYYSQKLKM